MSALKLMNLFCDGLVLQRDREYEIWGSSELPVTAELDGTSAEAKPEGGKFRLKFPGHAAGTGYTLTVSAGEEKITVKDICFGDVFIFSGQSNFETPCRRVLDVSEEEIAASDYPLIREYKINAQYCFDGPADEVAEGYWKKAQGADLQEMSAPAFFFAKEIHLEKGIPVGIVLNAIGGSGISSWMPYSALDDKDRGFLDAYKRGEFKAPPAEEVIKAAEKWNREINRGEPSSRDGEFYVPGMTMGTALDGMTGSVWFYKDVYLDSAPDGEGMIYIGELIDSDETYVNGVKVGETGYRYPPRKYKLPQGILRQGKNEIKVRLVINGGQGGFIPEHPYWLRPGSDVNGEKISLEGSWQYAVEGRGTPPAMGGIAPIMLPTGLFNASLAPLKGMALKGVLWYQGETDTGSSAAVYTEKFAAMVKGWREALCEDFKIICVEMPDYCDPITGVAPGWAEIQKAQREAPKTVPGCAAVSAKDLGAPYELHPQYKKELGIRLAAAGETLFYY